jgi:ABC-2 type transport system ATP-binding protein
MTPPPPTGDLAIDLRDVAKRYKGNHLALRGIEMHVRAGEIFGLLGPNGAGKSTLVKIIMTIVRPTRASGTVLGQAVGHKPTLARIGYLPENHRFPRYLTGRQIVEFFGEMAKVDRRTAKRRAAELIDLVGMSKDADRKVSTYSKGMAQRIGLAQALVNDPDLVLLDEPTDGVDPVGRRDIRDVLLELRSRGKTVFINSHLLGELEMICDRVAILLAGEVAKQGTIADFSLDRRHYEIEVQPDARGIRPLREVLGARVAPVPMPPPPPPRPGMPPPPPRTIERGETQAGVRIEIEGNVVRAPGADAAAVQPLIDALRAAGLLVQRVQPIKPSLEDLFIEVVSKQGDAR